MPKVHRTAAFEGSRGTRSVPLLKHALRRLAVLGMLFVAMLLLVACEHHSEGSPQEGPTGGAKVAGEAARVAAAPSAATKPVTLTVMPTVPAAPKPSGPLAADASCITPACHARFATAPHVHGPVSQKACDSCHDTDTGTHSYPLKRAGNATCTFCHAVAGTQSHQHAAIDKGGCISCHDPHASPAKFLLAADDVGGVCIKCHQTPLKKSAHRPFAQGQCTLCHQPHQTDTAFLLRGGNGPAHCLSCHGDMAKKLTTAAHVHAPAKENCVTCHGPHATDHAHQLKAPVNTTCFTCHPKVQQQIASVSNAHGAMLAPDGCASCHDPHASGEKDLLRGRTDKVCLTCHEKALVASDGHTIGSMKQQLGVKNLHGPVKSGDCSACHSPHGANQPNLLVQAFPKAFYAGFELQNYALCFRCHDQQLVLKPQTKGLTNFRDGERNLHFVHVNREEKGRSCKSCHAMHGSDQPKHIASDVAFENSRWAMPLHYEANADGGHCAPACHQPLGYNRQQAANPNPKPAPTGDTK